MRGVTSRGGAGGGGGGRLCGGAGWCSVLWASTVNWD